MSKKTKHIEVICCECKKVIKEGEEPASHTYCEICGPKAIEKLEREWLEEKTP